MLQKRHVFWLLESFAGKTVQAVDFVVAVSHVPAHADFESLLEVGEVYVIVQSVVVQFVENSASHLVRLQGDPIERGKLVLRLNLQREIGKYKCIVDRGQHGKLLNFQANET